jgi:hypothetical protein
MTLNMVAGRSQANAASEIRNLDSDRKSLVYDNYSKLLSATSTIRRMRGNMDPLAPTTPYHTSPRQPLPYHPRYRVAISQKKKD